MKNQMRVMDGSGDTKVEWDSDNRDETKVARDTFDKLTKKGYKGFRMKDNGKTGQPLDDFDPDAEKIIMVAPIAGG